MAALRVLTFSSLFPSTARPRHGIFVETRLLNLRRDCEVDARVVAPVPWFPSRAGLFGSYARFAATPRRDVRADGLQVSYPRYLMLPRIGVAIQPDSMARGALGDIRALIAAGWQPDLIDAHYLYPDGVAAARLARQLGLPFVMTARGTDVNVLARQPGPGRRIREAARQAAAVIAVSRPLKDALVQIGVDADKIVVLRNGVDVDVFRPADAAQARQRLALPESGRLLLGVGNLVPEKGQALAVEALCHLPDWRLLLVGDGLQRAPLLALAQRLGVAERVDIRPPMPQAELRFAYAAADVLALTSTREGWPNVVLEAQACGTPVVAFEVGAVAEMMGDAAVGRLVGRRDAAELAAAIAAQAALGPAREAVRAHAAAFDWHAISHGQWELFRRATPCRP